MQEVKINSEPKHKNKPRPKLKPIDKLIVKNLLEGKNQKQTAEIIGMSEENLSRKLSTNINIQECLNRAGITDEYLADKTKELIEAKRKLYNPKSGDFQDVPDNNARNSALSLAYKVKGHLKEGVENNQNIQINIVKYSDRELVKVEGNVIDVPKMQEPL